MRKTGCMSATRFCFALKRKGKVNPMESSNQFLETERIGKLMQKYAIPCIISLLVGALYMVREVVFGVGFALLLLRFFGLDGVLYSMPLSDILNFLIAVYLIFKTYRELSVKGES